MVASSNGRVLVWDAPTRVFHWLMVLSFAGAYLTGEDDHWRLVHVTLGYTMAGLVAFRVVWGFIGTRHARFTDFVRGPGAAMRYLRSVVRGQPEHHTGHNPAGALAVVTLLVLTVVTVATGWATYRELGGDALEELHEAIANVMLGLVVLHVVAVVVSSRLHRENLVGAMISGYKEGQPADAAPGSRRGVAAAMLLAVAAFWCFQWWTAPGGSLSGAHTVSMSHTDSARRP
jgi:cytochrome b